MADRPPFPTNPAEPPLVPQAAPVPESVKEETMHNDHQTTTDAPTSRRSPGRRRLSQLAVLGTVGVAGIAFAACGGSSAASSTSSSSTGSPASKGASTTPTSLPGASGTIAAVNGATFEVQNTESGQTTVTYTPSTTIHQTTTTTAAAVTVGSCISAFGKPTSSSSSTPLGEPITATTVSVSQPVSGACSPGVGGGFGGTRPGGFSGHGGFGGEGGTPPGGGSRPRPAGGSFARGSFGAASGEVTAVSGSVVTVNETNPQTKKTSSVTVTLTGTTTFTTTQTATAAAIVVGQCARAEGTSSTTGAVTANTLTISAPVNGACTSGFAGFRGGAGGGFGGGGAAGSTSA